MRIAFVTPEFVTENDFDGGLANYLYRVSLALLQQGHTPIIVVASVKNEVFIYNGIEVHRVLIDYNNKMLNLLKRLTRYKYNNTLQIKFQSWRLNVALKRIHKENPVDIIQYASYLATGYYRLKDVPAVNRVSSYQPLWREAYGNINPSLDDLKIEDLERSAFRKADGIFGPSNVIAKAIEKDINRSIRIIETPFLLDTIDLNDELYRLYLKDKKYLLFFGSIGLLKGADLIAEIIDQLLSNHPELFFVLVGKGVEWAERIKDNASRNRERVIYFNKMAHDRLYPIISNAFAVVLPSKIDNFPNTCLEAMAHKKVVIGTKGTSFEQLINHGVSGFLCKSNDSKDLFKTIESVLNLTDEERKKIGDKAYERIQKLRPDNVVKELLDYYVEIISKFKK